MELGKGTSNNKHRIVSSESTDSGYESLFSSDANIVNVIKNEEKGSYQAFVKLIANLESESKEDNEKQIIFFIKEIESVTNAWVKLDLAISAEEGRRFSEGASILKIAGTKAFLEKKNVDLIFKSYEENSKKDIESVSFFSDENKSNILHILADQIVNLKTTKSETFKDDFVEIYKEISAKFPKILEAKNISGKTPGDIISDLNNSDLGKKNNSEDDSSNFSQEENLAMEYFYMYVFPTLNNEDGETREEEKIKCLESAEDMFGGHNGHNKINDSFWISLDNELFEEEKEEFESLSISTGKGLGLLAIASSEGALSENVFLKAISVCEKAYEEEINLSKIMDTDKRNILHVISSNIIRKLQQRKNRISSSDWEVYKILSEKYNNFEGLVDVHSRSARRLLEEADILPYEEKKNLFACLPLEEENIFSDKREVSAD